MEKKDVEVYRNQVHQFGAYCMRSMQKTPGYIRKLNWTETEITQGLNYIQLKRSKKTLGFIEYAPGECSWRVVHADGYMVIHCLWVWETGMGLGTELIKLCIEDAKAQGKKGVAVLTSSDTGWAPNPSIFIRNGFVRTDAAPYAFELYVYKLVDEQSEQQNSVRFPTNWDERLARYSEGLTVLRTDQCPYLEVATDNLLIAARNAKLEPNIIHIHNRSEMMQLSPSPYGVFNVIYQGELISYHRMTPKGFLKKIHQINDQL